MRALVIVPVLAMAFFAVLYFLYCFVFLHPMKKRPDVHCIPESNLYKSYRDIMSEGVKDMENTAFETVSTHSTDDYRLYGKFYSMKKDAPLMIFFHGYHGVAAWDGYGFFKICKNNGINILMVDERAHGISESDIVTFGVKERYDCISWIDYAIERFGKNTDIILAGVSMGAASVMMASELGFPENVRAILADCGYSEPAAIIKETIKNMKLPVKPIYFFVNLSARIFGHFSLDETTALQAVRTLKTPILFIHGKQDSIVPISMNEELYGSCKGRKERVVIEGADHANSAMTDYDTYENAVMQFLYQILGK